MAVLPRILANLALLTTVLAFHQNNSKLWNEKLTRIESESNIPRSNSSFLYQDCRLALKEEDGKNELKQICNITIDIKLILTNEQQLSENNTCSLELLPYNYKNSSLVVTRFVAVQRFGESNDEVIITWKEQNVSGYPKSFSRGSPDIVMIDVLHMSNCTITRATKYFSNESFYPDAVPIVYQNTFDVITSNTTECGRELSGCRLSFDRQGRRISKPKPLTNDTVYHSLLEPSSVDGQAVFMYDYKNQALRMIYVHVNGQEIVLITQKYPDYCRYQPEKPLVSNAHELYGLCLRYESYDADEVQQCNQLGRFDRKPKADVTYQCEQFNRNSQNRLNVTVKLRDYEKLLRIYNLADGGMLLFTQFWLCQPAPGKNNLYVRMINRQGYEGKPLKLELNSALDVTTSDSEYDVHRVTESKIRYELRMLIEKGKDMVYGTVFVPKKFIIDKSYIPRLKSKFMSKFIPYKE